MSFEVSVESVGTVAGTQRPVYRKDKIQSKSLNSRQHIYPDTSKKLSRRGRSVIPTVHGPLKDRLLSQQDNEITRSGSNPVCFKHDNNVRICAVSALILLPVINMSLEMDSATSISYTMWKF